MNKWLKRTAIALIGALALWIGVALALVATPAPAFRGKAFEVASRARPACSPSPDTACYTARDGTVLHALREGAPADTVVLLLHGVLGDADAMRPAARALHARTGATVLSLDLRGHGASGGAFGDIAYAGQYEDDVADVVAALRREAPQARVLLAGHSMGGGIAVRYAARTGVPAVDGYLLYAPHLGDRAPTTRHDDVAAAGAEAPIKLHLRRTIGLLMLGAVGVHAFDDLGTLYFNVSSADGPLHYSFRAMIGCAPDDYAAAMRADDKPMLIVAGSADEAFDASAYPAAARLHANGEAVVVDGVDHDGIVTDATALARIDGWLRTRVAAARTGG
ncbi:MAG TPA: alpha/beta hydrolase [Dokdonella sp.]|nr:alpha/beta hydrolase [Dokdonella sp.]